MTKQKIHLSGRERQQDKARAVLRARNGTVNRCMKILDKGFKSKQVYLKGQGRIIIYTSELENMKKQILALKNRGR